MIRAKVRYLCDGVWMWSVIDGCLGYSDLERSLSAAHDAACRTVVRIREGKS